MRAIDVYRADTLRNVVVKMTPKEFAKEMAKLTADKDGDFERAHGQMDDLMCKLLKELGYKEGIKIFEEQDKWYA